MILKNFANLFLKDQERLEEKMKWSDLVCDDVDLFLLSSS